MCMKSSAGSDSALTPSHRPSPCASLQSFGDEPLIKLTKDTPVVKDNAYQHHVTLGGFEVSPTDPTRAVVVATLDNLLKGAATQAMQVPSA